LTYLEKDSLILVEKRKKETLVKHKQNVFNILL